LEIKISQPLTTLLYLLTGVIFTDKMSPQTLAFNYWLTVNNRGGKFKLGFSGVNSWKQYLFPKLKQ
jgi:hypothetical protein